MITRSLALALLLLAACASDPETEPLPNGFTKLTLGSTAHAVSYGNHLFSSQPGLPDFVKARDDHGIKTVIDLRLPRETPKLNEKEAVTALGMNYFNVPFKGPETLSDEVFATARTILDERGDEALLMHCKSGNRVGAIWYAWRVLDDGIAPKQAMAEAKAIGLRKPGHVKRSEEYVNSQRR